MSRTHKDRPHWVKEIQDGHPIEHDHTTGECIEETVDYVKQTNGNYHRRHKNCKKYVTVQVSCSRQKVDGIKKIVYDFEPASRHNYIRPKRRNQAPCWTWVCDGHTHDEYAWLERMYCTDKVFTYCQGHIASAYRPENSCACDDFPPRPTCTISYNSIPSGRKFSWTSGGVPSWFVTEVYHRPERHRSNTKLKDMAREYSYNGDIEDYDFENRQARNSARWLWW